MLSKELFLKACDFIKEKKRQEAALCAVLEDCCPDCRVDALIYTDYETMLVEVLGAGLNLGEDDDFLEYWLYNCNMGQSMKLGDYEVNGEPVDISTPEKFYDYATQKREGE